MNYHTYRDFKSTMMQRQTPPKCKQIGPTTEPELLVMPVNIEGLSSGKQQNLSELCVNQKCKSEVLVQYDIEPRR